MLLPGWKHGQILHEDNTNHLVQVLKVSDDIIRQ